MRLLTGRTRSLHLHVDITATAEWHYMSTARPPYWKSATPSCQVGWLGALLTMSAGSSGLAQPIVVNLQAQYDTTIDTDTYTAAPTYPTYTEDTLSVDGTADISVSVREVAEFVETWDEVTGYAKYRLLLYDETVPETDMVATISVGGVATASVSHTFSTPVKLTYDDGTVTSMMSVSHMESTCLLELTWTDGSTGGFPTYMPAWSHDDSHCTLTVTADTVSALAKYTGNYTVGNYGWVQAGPGAEQSLSIVGAAKAYDIDYPGTLDLEVDRNADDLAAIVHAAASWSDAATQHWHGGISGTSSGGSVTGLAAVDNRHAVRVRMKASGSTYSLATLGEDTADPYVPFRCWAPFTALSAQWADWTIDACDDLTPPDELAGVWSAVGGGTVSVDAGIRIDTAASGAQSLRRTFTDRWANLAAGRYLKLTTSGPYVAGIGVTLTTQDAGTKSWTRDKNGAALDPSSGSIELDLCNPDSATAETDIWDSRWPLPTTDSDYSGVTCLTQLDLTGLQTSQTYRVTAVQVVRLDTAEVTCMAARAGWALEQSAVISEEVTSDTYCVRGILGVVDGRQSFENAHAVKTVVHSSAPDVTTLTETPISTLLSTVGNPDIEPWPPYAGWTISGSVVTDPAEYGALADWLNTNRTLAWLRGGGWMYQWNAGAAAWVWVSGADIPAATIAASLVGQVCVDSIEWYPGCGDAFGFDPADPGAYGDTLLCAAAAVIRGGGHGLVFDDATGLPPTATQTVLCVEQSGLTSVGSGDTEANGWWESGTPYGPGERSVTCECLSKVALVTWRNRKRQRVCLRGALGSYYKCAECNSEAGWLHIGDLNVVKTFHTSTFEAAFASGAYGSVVEWRKLRWDRRRGVLYMLGIDGASSPYTWRLYASQDGGQTGGELVPITARSTLVECDSERGALVALWENSGNVQVQISVDGGANWSTAANALLWDGSSSAAWTGELYDVTTDRRRGNLVMTCDVGGSMKVLESNDLGKTWAVKLS